MPQLALPYLCVMLCCVVLCLDNNFISTFITTYRSFTTPRKLFTKLLERFEAPEVALSDNSRATAIQWRVAVVIKHWVETQFYDFDDDLIKELFRFVEKTLYNAGHTAMASALYDRLTNKAEDRNKRVQAMITVPPTDFLVCVRQRNNSLRLVSHAMLLMIDRFHEMYLIQHCSFSISPMRRSRVN
jgi:hypothetical protein